MAIWVDADACPVVIKEIIIKAAIRTATQTTFVANQHIKTPPSEYIVSLQVEAGFDVADNEIVKRMQTGDLVVTQDIPLADSVISQGGVALSPRGEKFTQDNIRARLGMRDFMETLRSSGIHTGGPSTLNLNDRKTFAGHLDSWLAKQKNAKRPD